MAANLEIRGRRERERERISEQEMVEHIKRKMRQRENYEYLGQHQRQDCPSDIDKTSETASNCNLEFFPRAVPDQRQCRARFSISGSNLTIVLYEGSIFISTLLRGY